MELKATPGAGLESDDARRASLCELLEAREPRSFKERRNVSEGGRLVFAPDENGFHPRL